MIKPRAKRSKFWLMPEDEFRTIALSCKTMTEFMEKLGAPRGTGRNQVIYGSGYAAIRSRVQQLGLTDHFDVRKRERQDKHLLGVEEYTDRGSFKKRIIRDKLIPHICEICGNTGEWLGKPLVLQLDHKNGRARDHKLTNVRFLCPNCHSQTENWTGRNVGKASPC